MPRTLPWLLDQAKEKRVKHEETPRKRVKRESDVDPDVTPKPLLSPEKRDFFRSSQTPPTSPARPGPTEEYILDGLDRDDAWVMVEDEFYTVAQSFTQHLHYAEYIRRKKEAKARGEAAIGEVDRPTDGRTAIPKILEMKKQAEELQARQKDGMAQLGLVEQKEELSDDDDDTWAGTHLHGLMTSPQKSRSLIGVQRLKSSTRAAAGFGQTSHIHASSSRTTSTRSSSPAMASPTGATGSRAVTVDLETASEDDDLDGDSYPIAISLNRRINSPPRIQPQTTRPPTNHRQNTPTVSKRTHIPAQASRKPRKSATVFKSKVQMLFDDLDELPEPSQSSSISDRKKHVNSGTNTPQRAPSDNNFESKSRYKDVPTFLV
ncbi:hypothetical protein N7540_000978 [Penicillium herquei]|nr:hypothetical protein N7540_000978 [Penicillium herquei]